MKISIYYPINRIYLILIKLEDININSDKQIQTENIMKIRDYFEHNGYAVINDLITPQQLTDIEQQLEQINLTTAGSRELLTQPWCSDSC